MRNAKYRTTWYVIRDTWFFHIPRSTFHALIRLYQLLLSPWLGVNCRFEPSCSRYAETAFARHGVIKGGLLAVKRLLRCHPLGSHGYDPVP